jgi:hypothetical protein
MVTGDLEFVPAAWVPELAHPVRATAAAAVTPMATVVVILGMIELPFCVEVNCGTAAVCQMAVRCWVSWLWSM